VARRARCIKANSSGSASQSIIAMDSFCHSKKVFKKSFLPLVKGEIKRGSNNPS
jgi:hypothetical protein